MTDLKQAITSNNLFGSIAFTLFLPHLALMNDKNKLYQLEFFKLQLATNDGLPLNPDLQRVMQAFQLPKKAAEGKGYFEFSLVFSSDLQVPKINQILTFALESKKSSKFWALKARAFSAKKK